MSREVVDRPQYARVPRCVRVVEEAVLDLLCNFRDPDARDRARDRVRSLSSGCGDCDFRAAAEVLRAIDALLEAPPGPTITERLVDLVGQLKAHACAGSSKSA
jgi:hypothetical protein